MPRMRTSGPHCIGHREADCLGWPGCDGQGRGQVNSIAPLSGDGEVEAAQSTSGAAGYGRWLGHVQAVPIVHRRSPTMGLAAMLLQHDAGAIRQDISKWARLKYRDMGRATCKNSPGCPSNTVRMPLRRTRTSQLHYT
jgi:hypothetical protein